MDPGELLSIGRLLRQAQERHLPLRGRHTPRRANGGITAGPFPDNDNDGNSERGALSGVEIWGSTSSGAPFLCLLRCLAGSRGGRL